MVSSTTRGGDLVPEAVLGLLGSRGPSSRAGGCSAGPPATWSTSSTHAPRVLAGEGTNAAELFTAAFRAALAEAAFDGLAEDLNVVVHPWKDEAWARGATCLVLNQLFAPQVASRATPVALLPTDLVG